MSAKPPKLQLHPLNSTAGLRQLATDAIKRAITEMDIYRHHGEFRLDERQLSQELGVSRTPIREALGYLEQEGLVRSIPRRGVFVVRKTKAELLEMILVWAAIEGSAARLAAERASEAELARLRHLFDAFEADPSARLDEYSQANTVFHKAIIGMGGCALMSQITDTLSIHMRALRAVTMGWGDRARRSMRDHHDIIAALDRRDADAVDRLVREHTQSLKAHIEQHGDQLDGA